MPSYNGLKPDKIGEVVGRRTKIILDQATLFAAFKKDFRPHEWPPTYPVEYLLSKESEGQRFHRLSEQLRAGFVYDVANQRFPYRNGGNSPIRAIFGLGDNLRVDADALSLLTTPSQYKTFFDVVVNLLVYRDETQAMRHEQLERIVLATNIFNDSDLMDTVESMQTSLRQGKRALVAKLSRFLTRNTQLDLLDEVEMLREAYEKLKMPWDELALVIDALQIARANRDKLKQRQTRLLLDVRLGKIEWTLVLDKQKQLCSLALQGIHDSWLSAPDGTQSNLIEVRSLKAINKLPGAFYKTLLAPVPPEIRDVLYKEGSGFRGIGTQGNAVRFYFKARPPVGGILLVEHVELNLTPLQIQLTYDIAEEIIKFFFPPIPAGEQGARNKAQEEKEQLKDPSSSLLGGIRSSIRSTASSFLSKGPGDTSITDVENFILKLPDFEYHSQIWSWLELTLNLRRDCIRVLLSNVGALVKDKIKRLGQANVPESERSEESLKLTASRLGSQPPPEEDPDSKEAQVDQIAADVFIIL